METSDKTIITVEAMVNAPVEKVWEYWTEPSHITRWSYASEDWHTPYAENDLRTGGAFKSTMAAKDGSMSFDFGGIYDDVQQYSRIEYTLGDARKVEILFQPEGASTKITESFEAESTNPAEMQQGGWQAILNNFKKYAESSI